MSCSVSSHDQKEDLKRQANTLSTKLEKQNTDYIVIKDLGSGLKQISHCH